MLDNQGYRNTIIIFDTYCFPMQKKMVMPTRINITLYVHCLSFWTLLMPFFFRFLVSYRFQFLPYQNTLQLSPLFSLRYLLICAVQWNVFQKQRLVQRERERGKRKNEGFSRSLGGGTKFSLISLQWVSNFNIFKPGIFLNKKCKAVPLQAWSGPEGSRKLR